MDLFPLNHAEWLLVTYLLIGLAVAKLARIGGPKLKTKGEIWALDTLVILTWPVIMLAALIRSAIVPRRKG